VLLFVASAFLQHGRARSAKNVGVDRASRRATIRPTIRRASLGCLVREARWWLALIGRPIVDFLAGGPTLSITVLADWDVTS
jgi:hypothetical protein